MIEIIPAIDILEGKCVRLSKGDFSQVRVYSDEPVEMALAFAAAGVSRLHMVDLDGARSGKLGDLGVLNAVAKATPLVIDFSGGIRSADDLRRVFEKLSKNSTKWIDPRRRVGIGSARRHDGGRPRDKASIAVLTSTKVE